MMEAQFLKACEMVLKKKHRYLALMSYFGIAFYIFGMYMTSNAKYKLGFQDQAG